MQWIVKNHYILKALCEQNFVCFIKSPIQSSRALSKQSLFAADWLWGKWIVWFRNEVPPSYPALLGSTQSFRPDFNMADDDVLSYTSTEFEGSDAVLTSASPFARDVLLNMNLSGWLCFLHTTICYGESFQVHLNGCKSIECAVKTSALMSDTQVMLQALGCQCCCGLAQDIYLTEVVLEVS